MGHHDLESAEANDLNEYNECSWWPRNKEFPLHLHHEEDRLSLRLNLIQNNKSLPMSQQIHLPNELPYLPGNAKQDPTVTHYHKA